MAAFDLSDLIPDLVYAISIPGVDEYGTVTEDEWVSRLSDGFWTGFNFGLFREFTLSDGIVTHRTDVSITFPRDRQQMVILLTSIAIVTRQLMAMNTVFRTKAGPVEYETQQSATLLNNILNALLAQRDALLDEFKRSRYTGSFFVADLYDLRQSGYRNGSVDWVGN